MNAEHWVRDPDGIVRPCGCAHRDQHGRLLVPGEESASVERDRVIAWLQEQASAARTEPDMLALCGLIDSIKRGEHVK